MWPFRNKQHDPAPVVDHVEKDRGIPIGRLMDTLDNDDAVAAASSVLKPYEPPAGVVPESKRDRAVAMAADALPMDARMLYAGVHVFRGYDWLGQKAQEPEYRYMAETNANDMTRKWIKVRAMEGGDYADKIKDIEEELRRLDARAMFRQALEHDDYFGRGTLYIEVKTPKGSNASRVDGECATELFIDPRKITRDSIVSLRVIEPRWLFPGPYNTDSPLKGNFYQPQLWYCQGDEVHDSRLLTFISRPVPDILKPVYNFGGLSLTQLADDYVTNWQRTRDYVAKMLRSYSTTILKTSMGDMLQGKVSNGLMNRLRLFARWRDNNGIFALDKDTEEFDQINTPLAGLKDLKEQALEELCVVARQPRVKLLRKGAAGLNASSEGEIRMYYDDVHATQEDVMRKPLKRLIEIIQLSLFGEIDDAIDFEFVPLYQLSEKERSDVRAQDAKTRQTDIQSGVVTAEEARQSLAADECCPYPLDKDGNGEIDPIAPEDIDDDDTTQDPSGGDAERGRS